ncbi:outer membrane transport energization protein TonB [Duganella sp. CF458]|uniref:energy transducer TonB n=1 Tax=Duganella sp. CF458 TaxID=1884368 RepID=UPI0008EDC2A5|nr:energy transducer TonB [Duganella sp. CF458]SFG26359.1 outer membrane transport energization protein TonB [Duganella sp. CF458]
MNFDTSRKNYSGLAFVAVLHLVAAGIALKNSTILITREEPILVEYYPDPQMPEPKVLPPKVPDIPPTKLPVITPPEFPILEIAPVDPPITTVPPDGPPREKTLPGPSGPGPKGDPVEPARRQPVNVAAVIDAASCAKPAYPAAALRNGDEGTVTLAFLIGKDGHVASAKVERTSGHRDLDRAAMQGLSMCAFKPGTIDGVAQESWARMQYAWRLDE